MLRHVRMAPYPSGKGEVCKTFMHRFESDRRLYPPDIAPLVFHLPAATIRQCHICLVVQNTNVQAEDYETTFLLDHTAARSHRVTGTSTITFNGRAIERHSHGSERRGSTGSEGHSALQYYRARAVRHHRCQRAISIPPGSGWTILPLSGRIRFRQA